MQVHRAFLDISLPSLHDYGRQMPNLRFMKDVKIRQRFSFSFCELGYSLLELTAEKIAINIWQIIRVGIRAIKFETARIHFWVTFSLSLPLFQLTFDLLYLI